MQRLDPDLMREHCERFQEGLDDVAKAALHQDILKDQISIDRVRMPPRHGGLGLRNVVDVRDAAFLGCLNMVLPCMVTRMMDGGTLMQGYLHKIFGPTLGGQYNYGAIDHTKWLYEQSEQSTGVSEFGDLHKQHETSYNRLRARIPAAERDSSHVAPLHLPITRMGEGVLNLQHAITVALEDKVHLKKLQADMTQLPADDRHKIAYFHTTGDHLPIAMSFVTAWLCRIRLSPAEWMEMIARVFGLASPACAALVGKTIRGAPTAGGQRGRSYGVVDASGDNVLKAVLAGDGWRKRHDYIKNIISSMASSAGFTVDEEIYGIFAAQLNREALKEIEEKLTLRQRHGIVPDLMLQAPVGTNLTPDRVFYELKTLNKAYDVASKPGISDGAEKRGNTVRRELVAKLKKVEEQCLGISADSDDGPLIRQLNSIIGPKPLVVGKYADVNQQLRKLTSEIAVKAAIAKWKALNFRDEASAIARMKVHYRRVLGMACHKSLSHLLLDRLGRLDGNVQRQATTMRVATTAIFGADLPLFGQHEPHQQDMRFH